MFNSSTTSRNPTKSYALRLAVQMRFSYLWTAPYSPYQQELFDLITKYHVEAGWNFKVISDWLNTNGYKTPRGKIFSESHVWSIYTKKNRSIKRFNRVYEPDITDIHMEVIDYMPVKTA